MLCRGGGGSWGNIEGLEWGGGAEVWRMGHRHSDGATDLVVRIECRGQECNGRAGTAAV